MPKKPPPAGNLPDFEAALAELEGIVQKMESGEQSLEDALKSFQRGVELTRVCQQGLKLAEQKVEKLIRSGSDFHTEPLVDKIDDESENVAPR